MPIFKDEALLKEIFKKYAKYCNNIHKYTKNHPEIIEGIPIDPRDLAGLFILTSEGNINLDSEDVEPKFLDYINELKNNPTNLFNKTYNIYENFELENHDTNNALDIIKVLAFGTTNQCFSLTLEMNPEYRHNRYGKTSESQKLLDARFSKSLLMNLDLQNELNKKGLSLTALKEIKYINPNDFQPQWIIDLDTESLNLQKSYSNVLNGKDIYIEYNVGKFWADIDDTYKNYETNPDDISLKEKYNAYFQTMGGIGAKLKNNGSYTNYVTKAINDPSGFTSIYINGKQLDSLIDNRITDVQKRSMAAAKIFGDAIKKGKPIDIAQARVLNDEVTLSITPMKINYSKEAIQKINADEYKSHTLIRRKFFDWGPFKIKYIDFDNLYTNQAKGFNARTNTIKKSFESTLSDKIKNNYHNILKEEIASADRSNPNRIKIFDEPVQQFNNNKINIIIDDKCLNTAVEKEYDFENLEVSESKINQVINFK